MKELKILAVVVFFSLAVYILVEPIAHGVMHKTIDKQGFAYKDLPDVNKKGDATRGKDLVMGAGACTGCHSIEVAGIAPTMDALTASSSYGVVPPDLSIAGAIYDERFLHALIKNPAKALDVEHKFTPDSGKMHPMSSFGGAGGDIDQEIADMVAYLKSIAPDSASVTPTQAFENACGRCHEVRYTNWTQMGEKPKFKKERDSLIYDANVLDYQDNLKKYMGKLPPDLSMKYGARGEQFMSTFVENPQGLLHGTSMPRVGLNAESAEKTLQYLHDSYEPQAMREERDRTGLWVLGFLFILASVAYLWKREVWKDLH